MARRAEALLLFDALSIEGGFLPAEWLAKVAALEAPAQKPADYDVPKGLELRDEITRYWRIAEALWADYSMARQDSQGAADGATRRFVKELLSQAFGFAGLREGGRREVGGRSFDITLEGAKGRVPVVVGVPEEPLDASGQRHGEDGRRRSAWSALQEYLNASDDILWGVATNGIRLRIARDNASLTRPAWIEADLERLFEEERFADFTVLWLMLHASRFGRPDALPTDCPLEAWRDAAREAGTRAREHLRDGVESALLALGRGFLAHPSNGGVRGALAGGALIPEAYFNELLRLVYRMIFLLTVEEREILHADGVSPETRRIYAEGYGMRRLRERSVRRAQYDRHTDLWASLGPVFAALGRPGGEPALGLPELGGLFAPGQCPHLDGGALENRALLEAVFRLTWMRDEGGLARVNWKDMGPEELGSVYESLLELVPVIGEDCRTFGFAGADESAGNVRKLTGSYYTPDSLVQELLDTALEPVIAQRLARDPEDPERALLGISVLDPACGSGHFLLAAARRLASHLARLRTGGSPGAHEFRAALRDVVTHCIHGVDRNPMALELARMSLWLETYTPERALGFLDHHLVLGDALLGLVDLGVLKDGIPNEAYKALTGDDREVCTTLRQLNRKGLKDLQKVRKSGALTLQLGTEDIGHAFARLEELSDDRIENVAAKRARYEELRAQASSSPLALAADLYVGAFVIPKRLPSDVPALTERDAAERFPLTGGLVTALEGMMDEDYPAAVAARRACRRARVLHWPLAFPQVFGRGGFDVVLGNPPWEMLQTDAQEFFAYQDPEIAQAPNLARRQALIEGRLREENPALYSAFREEEARVHRIQQFVHSSGRYPRSAVGRINLAPLFAELSDQLRSPSGRAGLVLPTGIATDSFTQRLFRHFADGRLVSLYDFENRQALFSAVDSRQKFALFTIGRADAAEFAFFLTQVHELADDRRRFELTAEDFRLINPNTRTCAIFRSRADAELTKKIYRNVPVLVDETKEDEGNPWAVSFMLMFMMNTDSRLFLDEPQEDALPLYEGKMIHQFDHRWATYEPDPGGEGVKSRNVTDDEKAAASFSVHPRYWVPAREVHLRAARLPASLLRPLRSDNQEAAQEAFAKWLRAHESGPCGDSLDRGLLTRVMAQAPEGSEGDQGVPVACEESLTQYELELLALYASVEEILKGLLEMRTPRWFMGWRDITNATNERTVIASVIPKSGVGNNLPLMLFGPGIAPWKAAALLGNLSALTLDFVARHKVGGTHLNFFLYEQLPVLPPTCYREIDLDFIVARVLELTYTADDLRPWAEDLDYHGPPFAWDPERRAVLRAELDAYYARLYGLTRDELRYILDPADVMGPDYPSETFRVLKENEQREFGEYRTRRLVLDAWDRMAESDIDIAVPAPSEARPSRDVIPFPRIRPSREERYVSCLPLLTLEAAAGQFSDEQSVDFEDWVAVGTGAPFRRGMFVARVVGRSMEPLVPDGAWCIFDSLRGARPRNDDIVLAELHEDTDPEHGGRYTVKRFSSRRSPRSDGEWQSVVRLAPHNPAFSPIVLSHSDEDEPPLRVIARLVQVLDSVLQEG